MITFSLLGITIGVFLLQMIGTVLSPNSYGVDPVALWGMKINEYIIQGQFWRLVTPMFLHGSILHLGFNMYALFVLGPGLERYYGRWRFLMLYLLSGFAGNVFSFLFTAAPSLGSSTAIFGLLGAQGIFLYRNRDLFGPAAQRALINVVVIALINLMIGLSPGIDNWGHLGGLIGGTLFAWFGGPVLQVWGMYPSVQVVDERDPRASLWVGLGVGFLFVVIAVAAILFRM